MQSLYRAKQKGDVSRETSPFALHILFCTWGYSRDGYSISKVCSIELSSASSSRAFLSRFLA